MAVKSKVKCISQVIVLIAADGSAKKRCYPTGRL